MKPIDLLPTFCGALGPMEIVEFDGKAYGIRPSCILPQGHPVEEDHTDMRTSWAQRK